MLTKLRKKLEFYVFSTSSCKRARSPIGSELRPLNGLSRRSLPMNVRRPRSQILAGAARPAMDEQDAVPPKRSRPIKVGPKIFHLVQKLECWAKYELNADIASLNGLVRSIQSNEGSPAR